MSLAVTLAMASGMGVASGYLAPRALAATGASAASPGVAVKVTPVTGKNITLKNQAANTAKATQLTWPAAASTSVTLAAPTAAGAGAAATKAAKAAAPSGTPVSLLPVADSKGAYTGPSTAQVRVLPHSASAPLGISGVVFALSGTSSAPGEVQVGLDYQAFAQEYGGNYSTRLELVQLPACALTTPGIKACQKQTPLSSQNQAKTQQVSAAVMLGGPETASPDSVGGPDAASKVSTSMVVLAATTSPGAEGAAGGTYAATSLKPSASWNQGGDSGSFDYSYPITVPGASSALVPSIGLSYSSQEVDGQTATSQAQSSWVGDGWGTPDSFVEQTFATCSDAPEGVTLPPSESTGDECYDGPILTLSLDGSSTSLVCNTAETSCTAQSDTGDVVTHVPGASNGSGTYNTDYWVITERDGTKYYFGRDQLPGYASGDAMTNSVDTEPVYSDAESTDPCYGDTNHLCTMAYRWHLDYVTNLTGQAMSYYYKQSTNEYGEDNGATDVSYVRDSYLSEIDYGYQAGGAYGTVPDKVVFTPNANGRCFQSSCTSLTSPSMTATLAGTEDPDVPFDLMCASGTTCAAYSPSFFSTTSLGSISTEQYSTTASAYKTIDSYALAQTEPQTNDTTNATLWLNSIQHTGMDTSAGGSTSGISMPSETFAGTQLPNRVDTATYPALNRYRLTGIESELGAKTTITYSTPNTCTDAYVTAETASTAQNNTDSCYPVYWTPPGFPNPIMDWFESYAVTQVQVADTTAGGLTQETDYSYGGGAAWRYDDNEVVKAKYRTYGQFAGYSTVTTLTGQAASNPQTKQVNTYYRGMDQDWSIASGAPAAATVNDSLGGVHTDSYALAGDVLEFQQYLGNGGPLENDAITSYWVSGAVQTRTRTSLPPLLAQMTGVAETWKSITDSDHGETGVSTVTETDTTYDPTTTDTNFGLPLVTYSHTVPDNDAYSSCIVNQYTSNTTENLVGLISYQEVDQLPCGGFVEGAIASVPSAFNTLTEAPDVDDSTEVISATQTFYDDTKFSTTFPQANPPTDGLVTMARKAKDFNTSTGALDWQTSQRATYDGYGRTQDTYDADGNETVTTYAVNSVGLTIGETVAAPTVNGIAHTTSETLDPTRGLVLTSTDMNGIATTQTYDALGRLDDVWEHSRTTSESPDLEYAYTVSNSALSGVTTQTLNDAGVYNTSVSIDDSLGRTVETQAPTPAGGRLINETFYDTRGWVLKKNTNFWDSTTTPTLALVSLLDSAVPTQDDYVYDGLGRTVQDLSEEYAAVKSTTTTVHNGDSTTVIPPTGGTVKTTATDPIGRTTQLIEYTANPTLSTPSNTFTGVFSISGGTPVTTSYSYNTQGTNNASGVQNSMALAGATWSQTYNLLGQETSTTDPDAGTSTMTYDGNGNLLQSVDGAGKYLSYTYDALGRKIAEYNVASGSQVNYASFSSLGNEVSSWAYDNANNAVAGMSDAIGQTTTETSYAAGYAYVEQSQGFNVFGESLGTAVTIPTGAPGTGATIAKTWTFDDEYTSTKGLLASEVFPAGGGLPSETTDYAYTSGLNLYSSLGGTVDAYDNGTTYTSQSQVEQTQLGTSSSYADVTDQYDPHTAQLTNQLVTRDSATANDVDQVGYGYDPAGLTTSETDTRLGATATSETQCYVYTTQDQLAQAWTATDQCNATPTSSSHTTVGDNLAAGDAYDESWTYNSNGTQAGETSYSKVTGQTTTTTDTYNGNVGTTGDSQPTTLTSTSTSTTGSSTVTNNSYAYTADGQQKTRGTGTGNQSLTWNNQGELSAVSNSTSNVNSNYVYDSDGNLLLETDGASTTVYLPSEQVTYNSTAGTTTGVRYYTLPGGATAVRTGIGNNYTFEVAADQHGTNTLYLDYTCQVPTWRQYDPYGNTRGAAQTWVDNRGFLDKVNDTTTGLIDIGARWYDPATDSFISLDPLLEANDPTQLAGYDYAGNDPVSGSDPTGDQRLQPKPDPGGNGDVGCSAPGFIGPCPVDSTDGGGDSGSNGNSGGNGNSGSNGRSNGNNGNNSGSFWPNSSPTILGQNSIGAPVLANGSSCNTVLESVRMVDGGCTAPVLAANSSGAGSPYDLFLLWASGACSTVGQTCNLTFGPSSPLTQDLESDTHNQQLYQMLVRTDSPLGVTGTDNQSYPPKISTLIGDALGGATDGAVGSQPMDIFMGSYHETWQVIARGPDSSETVAFQVTNASGWKSFWHFLPFVHGSNVSVGPGSTIYETFNWTTTFTAAQFTAGP